MQVFSIYKATNKINGKVYIGFDSNWSKRQKDHKSSSFNENSIDYNSLFHKAIRNHGWNNFKWEIICQSLDGEYLLNTMEPYFIVQYNSFIPNGYNMTKGGEGRLGYICSTITKQKISIASKNKPKSEKHKQNLSIAHTGKKLPEKTKEKMRKPKSDEVKKNRLGQTNAAKNWLLIDPQGNEYIVNNLSKFCRDNPQHNLKSTGNLKEVSNGNRKHYKQWKCTNL